MPSYSRHIIVIDSSKKEDNLRALEQWRLNAYQVYQVSSKFKLKSMTLISTGCTKDQLLAFTEGLALSTYKFQKYKSKKEDISLNDIRVFDETVFSKELTRISNIVDGNHLARDLVNEPLSYLTATQLSNEIKKAGKKAGFKVNILHKKKIAALKMGGLLAVSLGSKNPPTFNILEWKPAKTKNKRPIVLVGKGVVYDTGGLSLKPTPNSMDRMKSDMAGAAAVIGAMFATAKNKLPLHVIGLIPATENRPAENAYVPGDVIHMHNGMTVEVLNTDAEGRMILADALSYAKIYKPELVIDLATLTGAAAKAIGSQGMIYMGTADNKIKKKIEGAGNEIYERMVELPLWEEYDQMIQSDIADLKNVGGVEAGAITAGKFLEHFTDYPWLHLDIAGVAFTDGNNSYKGKNGTGVGVRLLYQFLENKI
ncbi:MAG: leucyl aminopeptidase [Bacteroidetes bacterium]|nr:leucyl aminopeptidase [Bacteroidota bacterium]